MLLHVAEHRLAVGHVRRLLFLLTVVDLGKVGHDLFARGLLHDLDV